MYHKDPLEESTNYFVDGLIDQAVEAERERHMAQKGRLLKQRVESALEPFKVHTFYGSLCPRCDSYHPKDQTCLMPR